MTTDTTDFPTRSNALPAVPLTDTGLEPLLEQDNVTTVWVPVDRPESVETRSGEHEGDILSFWVETTDRYVSYQYTSPEDGSLAWYRYKPTAKDADDVELIRATIKEDYRPLTGGPHE